MMCLICWDVWEGRDWEELLQSGDKYTVIDDKFICPLCLEYFESMTSYEQERLLNLRNMTEEGFRF